MMPNLLQYPVALFGASAGGLCGGQLQPPTPAGAGAPVEIRAPRPSSSSKLRPYPGAGRRPLRPSVTWSTSMGKCSDFRRDAGQLGGAPCQKLVPPWSLAGSIDFRRRLAEGRRSRPKPVVLGHDDPAFLQYTGGTTGVARGHAVPRQYRRQRDAGPCLDSTQ